MKNFKKIIALSLCLVMILLAAVACVDNNEETFEDYTSGDASDGSDTGFVTAPPAEETEDDAYINAAPANDEQGWGPLTPRPKSA